MYWFYNNAFASAINPYNFEKKKEKRKEKRERANLPSQKLLKNYIEIYNRDVKREKGENNFFFLKLHKSFQIKVVTSLIDVKSVNDFEKN